MKERQQATLLNYLANTVCQASKELFWILISTFSLARLKKVVPIALVACKDV